MDYENFKWALLEEVREKAARETTVRLHHIAGENGTHTDTISLIEEEGRAAPAIAVKPFYERYLQGVTLDGLAGSLLKRHRQVVREAPSFYGTLPQFDEVRERIFVRLMNFRRNEGLLAALPHVRVLDLAMVYYMRLDVSRVYDAMVLIKDHDLERWQIDPDALHTVALNNTVKKKKVEITALSEVLGVNSPDIYPPMYVLTNEEKCFGAVAMCYPNVIGEIARTFNTGFYVLPSSVHEVLIVPDDGEYSPDTMSEMVRAVNRSELKETEILSDHAYYCAKGSDSLIIASSREEVVS